MRTLRLELTLIAAALSFAACDRTRAVYVSAPANDTARAIRIGTFGSFSGPDARVSLAVERGFELAIEATRAQSGASGSAFELVSYDDQSRTSASTKAAERLATEGHVALIVGCSSAAHAVAAAAAAGQMTLACAACGDAPGLRESGVVALGSGVRERAEVVADQAVGKLGAKTVAVLARAQTASDREAAESLQASLHARGAQVHETIAITPDAFEAILNDLVSDSPQAVCVAFEGGDAARLGLALRRKRLPSALFYMGAPDLDALPAADRKSALEGVCFPATFDAHAEGDASADFAARFRARFGLDATADALAGYAAGLRVIDAFARATKTPSSDISSTLRDTTNPFPLFVMRVESGRFTRVAPPKN